MISPININNNISFRKKSDYKSNNNSTGQNRENSVKSKALDKNSILEKNYAGSVLLHNADSETARIIAEIAPEEFKKSMLTQNIHGDVPLHNANSETLKIMAQFAPEEFKQAMLIQNTDGDTARHKADREIAEIMETAAPKEAQMLRNTPNKHGIYPIYFIY